MSTAQKHDTLSIRGFLKAAKPDWSPKSLDSTQEKLGKVGISEVQQLVDALDARGKFGINTRLKDIGEKAFTQETLTSFRRHWEELQGSSPDSERAPATSSAYHPSSGSTSSPSPVATDAARDESSRQTPTSSEEAPKPLSKAAMHEKLWELGLEVTGSCQARQLHSIVSEVQRFQSMSNAWLLAECTSRSLPCDAAVGRSLLVRQLVSAIFPELCQTGTASPHACEDAGPGRRNSGAAVDASDQKASRMDEPAATSAMRGRGQQHSPAKLGVGTGKVGSACSLESLLTSSKEELLGLCRSSGIATKESDSKGMLALLLKIDRNKELLRAMEESQGCSN